MPAANCEYSFLCLIFRLMFKELYLQRYFFQRAIDFRATQWENINTRTCLGIISCANNYLSMLISIFVRLKHIYYIVVNRCHINLGVQTNTGATATASFCIFKYNNHIIAETSFENAVIINPSA